MERLQHIKRYMTACPELVEHDTPLHAAERRMADLKVHHLPVVRDEQLIGVLSSRDIRLTESLVGDRYRETPASKAMTEDPFTCGPEAQIDAVAREMLDKRCGSAIVVNRDKPRSVLGIFTVTDALRLLARLGDAGREL